MSQAFVALCVKLTENNPPISTPVGLKYALRECSTDLALHPYDI